VPFDAKAAFGSARAPVRCTINGVDYRSRLAVYSGRTYLGLRRDARDAAGLAAGDAVEVTIERDDEPREVDVPPALTAALAGDDMTPPAGPTKVCPSPTARSTRSGSPRPSARRRARGGWVRR